ncbi:transcription initiation factor IIA subunit gamma [Martiniozyma asiatica (nom. inval.)]|nr:transcription initiation factor IIA subunit gamma [Martiniozyma asiatica]
MAPASYEFYRRASVGGALADALDGLIVDQQIPPQLALRVLAHFDRLVSDHLRLDTRAKLSFKGHLHTYRFCDDVWTFLIKDLSVKLDHGESLEVDKCKIVACNSKRAGE